MDINYKSLSRVLKYSFDNAAAMVESLHQNGLAREAQNPNDNASNNTHILHRLTVADALADAGRHKEEALLRDLGQQVMVHEGRIRPSRIKPYVPNWQIGEFHDLLDAYGHPRRREYDWRATHRKDDKRPMGFQLSELAGRVPVTSLEGPASFKETMKRMMIKRATSKHEHNITHPHGLDMLNHILKTIDETPYEEIDTDHPSEQNQPTPTN